MTEPLRSCLGCREVRDKSDLMRFVLAPDRTLVPDLLGKLPGRGAYTCLDQECLQAAVRKKQFARAFRGEVKTGSPEELLTLIRELLLERIASYIALANKAGKVVSGNDMVEQALKRNRIGLLFIAADMSPAIGQKVIGLADCSDTHYVALFTKERLGALLGKELRAVVGIENGGFVTSLRKELDRYRNFVEGGAYVQ